jgi:hypothetical protein
LTSVNVKDKSSKTFPYSGYASKAYEIIPSLVLKLLINLHPFNFIVPLPNKLKSIEPLVDKPLRYILPV